MLAHNHSLSSMLGEILLTASKSSPCFLTVLFISLVVNLLKTLSFSLTTLDSNSSQADACINSKCQNSRGVKIVGQKCVILAPYEIVV